MQVVRPGRTYHGKRFVHVAVYLGQANGRPFAAERYGLDKDVLPMDAAEVGGWLRRGVHHLNTGPQLGVRQLTADVCRGEISETMPCKALCGDLTA